MIYLEMDQISTFQEDHGLIVWSANCLEHGSGECSHLLFSLDQIKKSESLDQTRQV